MNRQQGVYHRFIDNPQPQCCQNGLFGTFPDTKTKKSAEGQTRTVDTGIFSAVLYHLSYLGRDFYYRIRRGGCQGGKSPRTEQTHSKKPLNNRRPEIYSGYAGLGRDSGPENLSLSGFL